LAYEAVNTGDGVGVIQFDVQVTNTGSGSQDLTQMTIQYYFTADGASDLADQIIHAAITTAEPPYNQDITTMTTAAFWAFTPSTTTADTVLTISFLSGSLPSAGLVEVDLRANSANYDTNFTQSNDYSYNGADTAFTPSQTLTMDVAGATVWGMPP
jgi:Cellulose binding domain